MKHYLLHPVGSSGDVYPFLGLGIELVKRGHRITVMTSGYFRDVIENAGLEFVEVQSREEFLAIAAQPEVWRPHKGAVTLLKSMTHSLLQRVYLTISEIKCDNTILVAPCLGFGAKMAAEKLGIPFVTVALQPALLWSNFDTPRIRGIWSSAPAWIKRVQYWVAEKALLNPSILPTLNRLRSEVGLKKISSVTNWWLSSELILCLFPEWFAARQKDWPKHVRLTSFPVWDEGSDQRLPQELEQFLDSGKKPIVFTPGSANMHGQEFFQAAVEASESLKSRAILASKFPDQIPSNLPSGIRYLRYAPFESLLPKCSAIVHHGGIGTMARGFHAGIPQLIMPMTYDQPDNARRVQQLGVGDSIEPRMFNAVAVAKILNRLLTEKNIAAKCQTIKKRIRNQQPFCAACNVLEEFSR